MIYMAVVSISAVPSYQRALSQTVRGSQGSPPNQPVLRKADEYHILSYDAYSLMAGSDAAAADASPAAAASEAATSRKGGGYQPVTFDRLSSFPYEMPDSDAIARGLHQDQIPPEIKALNNQKVSIEGFMLATMGYKDKVRAFVLLANQMGCCFGVPPPMNGWVYVTMKRGPTDFIPDVPVTVRGTLKVGEDIKDNAVLSIYQLEADGVDEPKEAQDAWVFR
jgi:hypothetical protein